MTVPKGFLHPEDRLIESALVIRHRLERAITEIDNAIEYIERCKKAKKKE